PGRQAVHLQARRVGELEGTVMLLLAAREVGRRAGHAARAAVVAQARLAGQLEGSAPGLAAAGAEDARLPAARAGRERGRGLHAGGQVELDGQRGGEQWRSARRAVVAG